MEITGGSPAEEGSEDLAAGGDERVNILIVDDLPEKLLVYEAILEELGQKLIAAHSGEDALKLVLKHEFAVILLDVNMPGMDGFEAASLIRRRKKSSHTPIIFLTAFTDEVRMTQGYASGAVDYLPTPVVPEILRAKVRVFIELSQMRRKAASQAEERAMRTLAEESARRSAFLVTASEVLARSRNQTEILSAIARIPVPYLADVSLIWLPDDNGPDRMEGAWMESGNAIRSASLMSPPTAFPWLHKSLDKLKATNQPQVLEHVAIPASPADMCADSGAFTPGSALVLPLAIREHAGGAFIVMRRGRSYDSSDISLAADLASRINVALENVMLVEKIQESDRRKDEFLATLSHELRNPLAPIWSALHVIRMTKDAGLRAQAEDIIERQLKHMTHLVDDLMDMSRITQGKIELRQERITLKEVFDLAVETVQPLIKQRGHALSVTLPESPVWLEVDSARISQIFSNLLNNAAKYTDAGGRIEVTAQHRDGGVAIAIRDNGIGIAAETIPHIFDMFSQVDSSIERAQGGLGIGLTLVKSLVEMHGGTIQAQSRGLNMGSEFIVTLPTVVSQDAVLEEPAPEVENIPASLRVLVVDDNEAAAKTMGWMIELIGQDIRLAHNGAAAIEIARAYQPSVVLLDIGLPGMDGYEVCRAMRQEPTLRDTVFIAQTGWGQAEHRRRSKEAGFDHHLVKPINMHDLHQLLGDVALARVCEPEERRAAV